VMGTAIASGVAFGLFFVCFARTGAGAGLWPVVAARAVCLAGFSVVALLIGCSFRLPRAALLGAIAAGALEISANTLYMLSASAGTMSLAATLTSLYPASTVILARMVLRERIGRLQAVGLAFALLAAVLMTAS
jgi:drug/metabolite transporter (DMT)-like permease